MLLFEDELISESMPNVLYTWLQYDCTEKIKDYLTNTKKLLVRVTRNDLQEAKMTDVPSKDSIFNATIDAPCKWNVVDPDSTFDSTQCFVY
jgi:hypothetical protein